MKEMTFALSLNGLIYTSRMRLVVLSIVNAEVPILLHKSDFFSLYFFPFL